MMMPARDVDLSKGIEEQRVEGVAPPPARMFTRAHGTPPQQFVHVLSDFIRSFAFVNPVATDVKLFQPLPVRDRKRIKVALEDLSRRKSLPNLVPSKLLRWLCDHYIALMNDDALVQQHQSARRAQRLQHIFAQQPTVIPDASALTSAQLVSMLFELTEMAYAFILLEVDHFEVVVRFLHTYTRWFEKNFSVSEVRDSELVSLANDAPEDEHEAEEEAQWMTAPTKMELNVRGVSYVDFSLQGLFRHMHQISMQMFLTGQAHAVPKRTGMPTCGWLPPLPPVINFDERTRTVLLHMAHMHNTSSVSQFAMEVYQHLRDPDGLMQFHQRVLHDTLTLDMPSYQLEPLVERERQLNAQVGTPSLFMTLPGTYDENTAPSSVGAEEDALVANVMDEDGETYFFVEHATRLGYMVDAAVIMHMHLDNKEVRSRAVKEQEQQQKQIMWQQRQQQQPGALAPARRLSDLPAVQAVLSRARVADASANPSDNRALATAAAVGLSPADVTQTFRVCLEIDGPWHYCRGSPYYPKPSHRLKLRQLTAFGWQVICVPHWLWNQLPSTGRARGDYLASLFPYRMLKQARDERKRRLELREQRYKERLLLRGTQQAERQAGRHARNQT
jgi:hypothetical protein